MISCNRNDETGWIGLWREQTDPAISPADVAAAYRDQLAKSAAPVAIIDEEPAVVELLLALPGYSRVCESWKMTRPWPSGLKAHDRSAIRSATAADAPAIVQIMEQSGLSGWDPEDLVQEILNTTSAGLLLSRDGQDVAFGALTHAGAEGVVEWLGVTPAFQRRGLGGRMLEALMAELDTVPHERVVLYVESTDTPAIRLYERYGFSRFSVSKVRLKYTRPT